ncbi:MAG: tRNA (N6-isopentenyl adenosine(37)-C2)-methylthiotransferase MiaB [Ruminococcaceae bacterium]|nr:tRNA (N6-isopentenyl adenosine(37)-C2)-methylthiotransferase MiaB [Oscillospiraceae bacterium]
MPCQKKIQPQTKGAMDMAPYIDAVRAYTAARAVTPRCFVLTFGCQQNVADSEKLAGMAASMGYEITDAPEQADLILVNTCAIREHAEQKALSVVGQYKHLREKNPDLIIGLCGCMVAQEHRRAELKKSYPYVSFTLCTSVLYRLPQYLAEVLEKGKRRIVGEEEYTVAEGCPVRRESTYRAWVSIMYGCNNFCSYCIVPYVRGRERSRAPEDIIAEVKALVNAGYKEITLLGQNVNSYGKERADGYRFPQLLADLDKIEGDFILRFMTSHPKDATKELVDVMAAGRHIPHSFHLPLQAGNDRILTLMNRHYTRDKYLEMVSYMREKMPDISITTDIIVAFPTETEAEFEETLDVLRHVRFDMIYSFIYSPRKGTPAAAMEGQIPHAVGAARMNRLLALQNEIADAQNEKLLGRCLRVLCEGQSKTDADTYTGRTDQNKIVFFTDPAPEGEWVTVKIERAAAFALYGTKVNKA